MYRTKSNKNKFKCRITMLKQKYNNNNKRVGGSELTCNNAVVVRLNNTCIIFELEPLQLQQQCGPQNEILKPTRKHRQPASLLRNVFVCSAQLNTSYHTDGPSAPPDSGEGRSHSKGCVPVPLIASCLTTESQLVGDVVFKSASAISTHQTVQHDRLVF